MYKWFIKDYKNVSDPKVRARYGRFGSIVGIIVNIVLAAGKMIVGALFGVISVLADGLNNLADCGSSVVSLISFKLASKPADKEHPYGHERIEYVASMIVAFLILIIAFELCKESVGKIITPAAIEFSYLIIGILVASIIIKCGMFLFSRSLSKKINSDVLAAMSADSLSDCVATTAVLIALVIGKVAGFNLDGYVGVLVALFVAWSGIGILRSTMSKLVGQAPDPEILDKIKSRILSHSQVLGVHDINVYSYGPNKYYASVHIELDASVNVLDSHELVDEIEQEFAAQTNISLTGHLDPIVVDDPLVNDLRRRVGDIVREIDGQYSMHDFRMVIGQRNTNLIFEIAIPFDCKQSEDEVSALVAERVKSLDGGKFTPVITVEKQL